MKITYKHITLLYFLGLFSACVYDDSPVDWSHSFDSKDNIPYGTSILYNHIEEIFHESEIHYIREKTEVFLEDYNLDRYNYPNKKNNDSYLFIYPTIFHSQETWYELLEFTRIGNKTFISNHEITDTISQLYNISINQLAPTIFTDKYSKFTTTELESSKSYMMKKGISAKYFELPEDSRIKVLGYIEYQGIQKPNYIQIPHGQGFLFLHAEPFVFTNYHMLKEDHYQYIVNCFSHFQSNRIYWDNLKIHAKNYYEKQNGGFLNSLSFIFKNEQLTWAFMVFCFSIFLFLLFNYKRKQHPVPVLTNYKNYSLDFVKTISVLYQNSENHHPLCIQRTHFYLDIIRRKYNLPIHELDEDFAKLLSLKSNMSIGECKHLVYSINQIKNTSFVNRSQFNAFHQKLETFRIKSKLYGESTQ